MVFYGQKCQETKIYKWLKVTKTLYFKGRNVGKQKLIKVKKLQKHGRLWAVIAGIKNF